MNQQINQLVKSIFQKESLEHCSLQELQRYAERHPYFGAAQLLLTKKMQVENHEAYDEQLQKTFLYFNNPLWVSQLLNETGNAVIQHVEEKKPAVHEPVFNKPIEEPVVIAEKPLQEVADQPAQVATSVTADAPKEELLFEPYHTVDYFASQGIKLKEEETPKDKFGKQLKSFTDWLKTMKKLPATAINEVPADAAEQKVEKLAENSLVNENIVTEAMAEVWEKQGNFQKSIEIYEKLSLLEPSKSAYFAARIAELKNK